MILSRSPIIRSRALRLVGRQGRALLVSELALAADERLVLATTHMESFLDDGPTRAAQLDAIFAELADEAAPTLFVGEPSRRLDRMLLRGPIWAPSTIEIIGDRSVAGDPALFPSDHFGLLATLVREP